MEKFYKIKLLISTKNKTISISAEIKILLPLWSINLSFFQFI